MNRHKGMAHRGDPLNCPENSMSAFKSAYDLGFTFVELDVQLSKDGVPVVIHDTTIDRTTNGTGAVREFTLAELQKFQLGENDTIPSLEEALLYLKDKMFVSVELKQQGNLYPGLEEKVLHIIQQTGMLEQVYVNSFDHFSVERMREMSPHIALGVIQTGISPAIIPFMKDINAKYLSLRVEYLTEDYARTCEEQGIQLVVWPVDDLKHFHIVEQYSSLICTTNKLEAFKSYFG